MRSKATRQHDIMTAHTSAITMLKVFAAAVLSYCRKLFDIDYFLFFIHFILISFHYVYILFCLFWFSLSLTITITEWQRISNIFRIANAHWRTHWVRATNVAAAIK